MADPKEYYVRSKFVKELTTGERRRFEEIEKQFRADTNGELAEIEYYELASLRFFCEDIETHIRATTIERVDKSLLVEYLRAKEQIIDILRRYREGKKEKKSDIADIKAAFQDFKIPEKKKEKVVINTVVDLEEDTDAVPTRETKEDS